MKEIKADNYAEKRKMMSFEELDGAHQLLTEVRFKRQHNTNLQKEIDENLKRIEKNNSEISEALCTLEKVYGVKDE